MEVLSKMPLRPRLAGFGLNLALIGALSLPAMAEQTDLTASLLRGEDFARTNCALCHAVDGKSASPHPEAPPFRGLSQLYPIEHLAEAFAEGVSVGHPDMPEFLLLEPQQIDDLLNWLTSIQE